MRRTTTIIPALIACVATAAAIAPAAPAKGGGGTVRSIVLHHTAAFPHATGKSTYKVKGSERELQVEVEHIRSLAGKHVNVFVNGAKLASPLVSGLGQLHLDRSTGRGQAVPVVKSGSLVRVRTLAGKLIVTGSY